MTNPEKATGKRAVPNCIHLEKSINLTEQGNIPKPWPRGTQDLPPPQFTGRRKRNGAGGSGGLGLLKS